MKKENNNRFISHIVSLVLGIISVLSTFFWYLSLPAGITSIVLGANSYKKRGSKMGLAGMITGIVGVSICIFIYISLIILILLNNYY